MASGICRLMFEPSLTTRSLLSILGGMLRAHLWRSAVLRVAVLSVMVSVALMPGMVRIATVHAHDHHGAHEHQHALFGDPVAAAGHHHDDTDDDHDQPSQDSPDGSVIELRVVGEAVTVQAAAAASIQFAAPLLLFAFVDAESIRPPSPPLWRDTSSGTGQSRICRIVQTSHALLL